MSFTRVFRRLRRMGYLPHFAPGLLSGLFLFVLSGCFNADMNFSNLNSAGSSRVLPLLVFNNAMRTGSLVFTVGPDRITPAPEVSFMDLDGVVLTSHSEVVQLSSFRDSQCTVLIGRGGSFTTVQPQNGVAIFSGLTNTHAGTFYLQGSAILTTGETIKTECSKGLVFRPGAADHLASADSVAAQDAESNDRLTSNPMSPIQAFAGGASFLLRAQVVDQYGNAVVPSAPIGVTFTGFSSNVSETAAVTVNTDSHGVAALSIAPSNGLSPWALFKATPTSSISGNLLFPVQLFGGAATHIQLSEFPLNLFESDPQYLKVTPLDSLQVPNPAFNSNVFVSTNSGSTLSSLAVPASGGGSAYAFVGVTAGNGVSTYLTGVTGVSGGSDGSLPTNPILTNATTDCSSVIGDVTAVGGLWHTPASWHTNTVSVVPTYQNRAVIPSGITMTGPTAASMGVGCVRVDGRLDLQAGVGLEVHRAEFVIGSGGLVNAGSLSTLRFVRGIFEGNGAQRLVLSANASGHLDTLEIAPTLPGGTDAYAFFINVASTSSLSLNTLRPMSNAGFHYAVYINGNTTVAQSLQIPSGVEVIVNPNATLFLQAGAVVNGALTVKGGGILKVGANQEIGVLAGGKLTLRGIGPAGVVDPPTGYARLVSQDNASYFAVAVSGGGSLSATNFYISGLGRPSGNPGINMRSGSSLVELSHGIFENFDPSQPVLTLSGAFSLHTLLDLHFVDHAGTLGTSGSLIDLSNLSSVLGIVQSSIVGSSNVSLKSKVTSTFGLLYWDF